MDKLLQNSQGQRLRILAQQQHESSDERHPREHSCGLSGPAGQGHQEAAAARLSLDTRDGGTPSGPCRSSALRPVLLLSHSASGPQLAVILQKEASPGR